MCVPYTTSLFLPIGKIAATFPLGDEVLPIRIGGGQGVAAPTLAGLDFATAPAVRLFSRKLRFALFREGPDALLGIRRP